MKLIGSLENFQPSSLLQWFQTERAEGVLAVHSGAGYRLRFEGGELVAAAHWPPGESLERRLRRRMDEARAARLRREAEARHLPLSDLLLELLGAEETARLVASHAEGVVFRLLEETVGKFFFDPPARALPASLRTSLNVSRILLECARRQDEEERLADWIPSATSPLRLLKDPVALDDTHSGLRGALIEGLREPRSRQQLEAMIPVESHAVRLKLAELVRSGTIEILPDTSVPTGLFEVSSASSPASVLHIAKSPTADDWPFLTRAEAGLLEGLRHGPRSLDEAGRTLRQDRQELTPVAELLADSGWISVQNSRPSERKVWTLAGAAMIGVFVLVALLWSRFAPPTVGVPGAAGAEATGPPAIAAPAAIDDRATEVVPEKSAPTVEEESAPAVEEESAPAETVEVPATRKPAAAKPVEANEPVEAEEPVETDEPEVPMQAAKPAVEAAPPPPPAPVALPAAPPPEAPARLMVNAVPYGFVRINGIERGTTPLNLDLPPGTYEIRVYREGYAPVIRRVELASATAFLESFHLELQDEEEDRR